MRKRIISMLFVLSAFIVPASVQAQWVVSDPGNLVQRQRERQGVRPDAR